MNKVNAKSSLITAANTVVQLTNRFKTVKAMADNISSALITDDEFKRLLGENEKAIPNLTKFLLTRTSKRENQRIRIKRENQLIRGIVSNNRAAIRTSTNAIATRKGLNPVAPPSSTATPTATPTATVSSSPTATATPTVSSSPTATPTAGPTAIETKAAVTKVLAIKVKDKDLRNMLEKYGKYMNTDGVRGGAPSKAEIKNMIDTSVRDNGFILGIAKDLTSGYEHFEYATYKGFENKLEEFIKTYPDSTPDIETIRTRFKADELKYRTNILTKFDDLANPNALDLYDKVKILMSGLDASSKLDKDIVKLFNRTKAVDKTTNIVTYPFEHADNKPFNKSEYITHCKFIALFAKIKNKYIFPNITDEPQEPKFDKLIEIESGYLQTKADEYEKNNSSSPVQNAIDLIIAPLDLGNELKVQLTAYKKVVWAEAEFTVKEFENGAMYDLVDDRLSYTVNFFDIIEPRLKGIQSGDTEDNPNNSPDVKSAATVILKDYSNRISNSPNKGNILSSIKNFTKKNRSDVDEGIYKKLENITNMDAKIQATKTNLITIVKNGNTAEIETGTNELLAALNARKGAITLEIDTNKNKLKADPNMAQNDKLTINSEITELEKEIKTLNVNITEVTSILSDKGIKDKNKRSTLRNLVGDKMMDKFTKPKPNTTVPGVSPDTTLTPDFDPTDTWTIVKPFEKKTDTDKNYVRIEIEGPKVKVGDQLITTTAEWNDARKIILGLNSQDDVKLPSFNGKIVFDVYTSGKMTIRMNNGETKTINNQAQLDHSKRLI